MAAPVSDDKVQLNFDIPASDKKRLEKLCAQYNDAKIGWMALLFLRYGMRHAKAAVLDDAKRTAERLPLDEPDLT
jgi:hypothetical protein